MFRRVVISNRRMLSTTTPTKESLVRIIIHPETRVAELRLNSPSTMNALTEPMGIDFTAAVSELQVAIEEQKVRAIVLRGEGKNFSAGGDLKWLRERADAAPFANSRVMRSFYERFLCIRNLSVPTIAAVSGYAIGAGCCLSLACDFRLATTRTVMAFTFPALGIHPGMGATHTLPRIVPSDVAFHLLMSGDRVVGKEALDKHLVLNVFENDEELHAKALEMAAHLASQSPIAVQSVVQTLRNKKFDGIETSLRREADSQALAYASEDYVRGVDAVKSKSKADFVGWELIR